MLSEKITSRSEKPLISIVTPSYNQARFIEETILSVKEQDYSQLEHIVIDGGSTDRTIDILRRYEDKYNLRWVSEPDEGQSDAVNKGFRMAKGDIIGWINSDDTYLPGAIYKTISYFMQHPEVDWLYGDGYIINSESYVLGIWKSRPFSLKDLLCEGQFICQPATFYRRSAIKSVGTLDPTLHFTMDYDLFIRLGLQYRAAYLPELLATRRLVPEAKSLAQTERFLVDWIATLDKFYRNSDLRQDIIAVRDRVYANAYYHGGIRCFELKDFENASRFLVQAWKLDTRLFRREKLVIMLLWMQCLMKIRLLMPSTYQQTLNKNRSIRSKSVSWLPPQAVERKD